MREEKCINRYGNKFTFTELTNGNVQWSGQFEYCSFGFLTPESTDVIDMVDPSGGPYMAKGQYILGKVIEEFKANDDGFEIIIKENV
jgi:hypothetical protein